MSDHISETPYYALLRPAALLVAAGTLAFAAFVLVSQGGAQRGAPSVQQPFANALAAAKLQQHTELLRREGYVDAEDLVAWKRVAVSNRVGLARADADADPAPKFALDLAAHEDFPVVKGL